MVNFPDMSIIYVHIEPVKQQYLNIIRFGNSSDSPTVTKGSALLSEILSSSNIPDN